MDSRKRNPSNMRYLRRSTKNPKEGDVFTFQMPSGMYFFGRVIAVDLTPPYAPTHASNLMYVYDSQSVDKVPPVEGLVPSRLLIPPFFTNKQGWLRGGVFETVEHRPLESGDVLHPHCFWDTWKKKYLDAAGQVLQQWSEPCGRWVLSGYLTVDDRVSEALGIPLVPDPKRRSKK